MRGAHLKGQFNHQPRSQFVRTGPRCHADRGHELVDDRINDRLTFFVMVRDCVADREFDYVGRCHWLIPLVSKRDHARPLMVTKLLTNENKP